MRVESIADPTPGRRDAVIAIAACGACFHDIVTRDGTLKAGVEMPITPGHEIAGEIVAIGSDVREFEVGDRVASTQRSHICGHCLYCRSAREPLCAEAVFLGDKGLNGGYAEYARVEVDNLARIPDGVSFEEASIAACAIGTELHAIGEIGRVRLGEKVLVTGAGGGLGIHGVQLARLAGAFVIAQTTSPAKVDALRAAGAHEVVVGARGADFAPDVREKSAGGVDVVIDNVGTPQFQATRRSLAPGGRWVMVGQLSGEFTPFNPAQLFLRSISLLSSTSTTRNELDAVLSLIARGCVKPVVSGIFALEDAAEAHSSIERGGVLGRIVLSPRLAPKSSLRAH
jgi:D-arabinose 1-dehydrogenase-like Zn-dependent alcohol dehydrogenase